MTSKTTRLIAATFAVTLAAGSISTAQARDNWGAAAAGLAGGLIIGGAIASSQSAYAYPPPAYYPPPPAYYTPAPTYYSYPPTTYYSPAPTYYSYAPSYYYPSSGYYGTYEARGVN